MTKQTKDVQTVIDELATKGVEALDAMANFTQEQVDHIVHQAAIAALDKHMYLAKLAVDETGRGIYEDKAIKNMYASEYIWNSIKYDKTVGIINENEEEGYEEYIRRLAEDPLSRRVKLSDLKDNQKKERLPNPLREEDRRRLEKYREAEAYLKAHEKEKETKNER